MDAPQSPGFDPGQTIKSFWEKREGTGGMILLALGAGAVYLWGNILPWVNWVLSTTLHSLLTLAAIIALYLMRKPFVMAFEALSRLCTSWFYSIDSIGIMEDEVKQDKKGLKGMESGLEKLDGEDQRLEGEINSYSNDIERARATAIEAKKDFESSVDPQERAQAMEILQLNGDAIQQATDARKELLELRETISGLLVILRKWYNYLDLFIKRREQYISYAKRRLAASGRARSVVEKAKAILGGDPDRYYRFQAADEAQKQRFAQDMGVIRNFLTQSKPIMQQANLRSRAQARSLLEQLETLERQQNQAALAAIAAESTTPTSTVQSVAPQANNNLQSLF